ncbi:MAG TPA: AMP-binding protein, partial [Ktedonobacteraceae bacterium]
QLSLVKQPGELKDAHFVSHLVTLDVEEWQHLKRLAVAHGLTPNAVLYTAYALVLATWSKTAHFTINMLFFNRFALHPQVDELIGNLSTTVLLEVDLREPRSFLSHAKRLQEQLWNDLAHSYVTGVHVIREVAKIQGWTSQAVMPITFSSGLNMMNEEMKDMLPIRSEGQWELIYQAIQTPQVYIDHQVYEDKNGLLLKWDMIDELFAEGMPEELLAAYGQLLHLLANDETTWQTQTRSLVPTEHLELYRQVNATEGLVSSDLLHMLVLRQARQRPTQRAVVSAQRTLSYADVACLATQIAHWLRQREARPNTLVAVVMEKGWEQVVATLGVLEAGAAYLPLDPTLPQERLWYVLRDAQVGLVVTQSWVEARLAWPEGVERLCVDSEEALAQLPFTPLAPLQQVEDLAYVIYTSGSTGVPKGVMIDHRGAVNTILDINERCKISSQDRVLALSALSFDLSVYDIFGTLSAGGVIVIPDTEASRNPAHWAQLLDQEQVTVWNSVPAFMEMLVEYLGIHNEQL